MRKRLIRLAAALFSALTLRAQKVTDVQFDQEGSRVKITYTLSQRMADISLSISMNGGMSYIRLRKVEGDVGERIEPGQHVIYWNANEEMEEVESDQVVFRVDCSRATPLRKTFVLVNGTFHIAPQWGCGLTVGQVKRVGWYVSLLTNGNLNFGNDGETKSTGMVKGAYPFYSTNSRKALIAANAGMTVRIGEPLWLYVGAGYGNRQYALQTQNELWYAQSDVSHAGLSADFGLMLAIRKFILSIGAQTIGYDYLQFKGGIGICL